MSHGLGIGTIGDQSGSLGGIHPGGKVGGVIGIESLTLTLK